MRPSRDQSMLNMALEIGKRSTCRRRNVGCVLTDAYGRVLAMGHNGVPAGMPHCMDKPCAGAGLASGTSLDLCLSAHAELNAMLFVATS